MCVDLGGKNVFLIGDGPQTREKKEKLRAFGPHIIYSNTFTEADAKTIPALVVVGDTEMSAATEIFRICVAHNIPINVVDVPELCTFFFPALILKGDLTVSISSGGKCPAVASFIRGEVEKSLPENMDDIIDWLSEIRNSLKENCSPEKYKGVLYQIVEMSFYQKRPLNAEEVRSILYT